MSKIRTISTLTLGAAMVTGSIYLHNDRFSNESIWRRQKGVIERVSLGNPDENKRLYEELRQEIAKLPGSNTDRCKFEVDYRLKIEPDRVDEMSKESFDPYHKCATFEQVKDTMSTWQGWIGAIGLIPLIAGISGIPSLFRRRSKFGSG